MNPRCPSCNRAMTPCAEDETLAMHICHHCEGVDKAVGSAGTIHAIDAETHIEVERAIREDIRHLEAEYDVLEDVPW